MTRYTALQKLLGENAVSKIRTSKVLLVGAGGIGCELVKELVLAGFGEIHLVDLDTIDLSNLNRQFLFGRQHVKQAKANVAAEVAGNFNTDVHIVPYVANIISSPEFSPKWFRSFNVVFNALDNAEARRHVNRMCVSTDVPLIDCGTAGFYGQVQTILPHESECYDCRSHPAPKSFPVCTIRSTPSQPIHCVVWSKSFLFALLFGPNDTTGEDTGASGEGEDPDELAKLNEESNELADLKQSLHDGRFIDKLVEKVFVADVERLLLAPALWENSGSKPPKPLELKLADISPVDRSELDEHRIWTPEQALGVLKSATDALVKRIDSGESAIEFDKDDEDALDFVTAATVLRSFIFGIQQKTKFEIKQMAGNIIPAIATTNALVSGLGVIEAMKIVAGLKSYLREVNIFREKATSLISDKLQPPDPKCPVSSMARTVVHAKPTTTLDELVEKVLKLQLGYDEVSLVTDRLIYDPDFDDQISKTLSDLSLVNQFVTVVDEDDRRVNLELYIDDEETTNELRATEVHIPLRPTVKRSRDDEESNSDSDNDGDGKVAAAATTTDDVEHIHKPLAKRKEIETDANADTNARGDEDVVEILDDRNEIVLN